MSVPPPHRRVLKDVPISERGLTQLREWLKGPKDIPLPEVLYYVHPVAPASTPPDHRLAEPHPAFENSWGNISNSDLATAFGVGRIGTGRGAKEQLFIQLAVTGGEGVPGSTIFTLPERFWPLKDRRIVVAMGTDGLGVGVVKVQASDGAVVFLGMVASGGDGTDETGEIRFDFDNEGGYLQVIANDTVADTVVDAGWGDAGIVLRDTTGTGIVLVSDALAFRIGSDAFKVYDTSWNLLAYISATSFAFNPTAGFQINLDSGQTFTVNDASANPILTLTG